MADLSIDFHALPDEQRDFVKEIVSEYGLRVVAIRFPPYEAVELDTDNLEEAFSDSSPFGQLAFTLRQPNLPVTGNMDLADKNPDSLWLDIGKRTKEGLVEAGLSSRTDNAAAFTVWKKIAKRLKGMTEKGALAVQPDTGATGPARSHRYTTGAKALEASGVTMLTITGIILKIGQTTDATRQVNYEFP